MHEVSKGTTKKWNVSPKTNHKEEISAADLLILYAFSCVYSKCICQAMCTVMSKCQAFVE